MCDSYKPSTAFYMQADAHLPPSRCKDCISEIKYRRRCTLRGAAQVLITNARRRAARRGHQCTLNVGNVLDMLWSQGARCYYSGVPLECLQPNSHWRMSLERLDNNLGYDMENCVLIAAEFNTSDQSRNKAKGEVSGTAQWSRAKVQYVWGPLPEATSETSAPSVYRSGLSV